MNDRQHIAEVIQRWGFWRDGGQWEKLATTFHPEGTIHVTWFNGRFTDFIEASREMRKTRRGSKHEIGGSRIEVRTFRERNAAASWLGVPPAILQPPKTGPI